MQGQRLCAGSISAVRNVRGVNRDITSYNDNDNKCVLHEPYILQEIPPITRVEVTVEGAGMSRRGWGVVEVSADLLFFTCGGALSGFVVF